MKILRKYGFTDVSRNDWSYDYILKLAQTGVIKGYEDGSFRPKNNITRAEIAMIIKNMYY